RCIGCHDLQWQSCKRHRMQYTKTDAIFHKCRSRIPIELKQDTVVLHADDTIPHEIDVLLLVNRATPDHTRIRILGHFQILKSWWHCTPVLIPNRRVDSLDDPYTMKRDIAKLTIHKFHLEFASL